MTNPMNKRRLGRGLDSLLGAENGSPPDAAQPTSPQSQPDTSPTPAKPSAPLPAASAAPAARVRPLSEIVRARAQHPLRNLNHPLANSVPATPPSAEPLVQANPASHVKQAGPVATPASDGLSVPEQPAAVPVAAAPAPGAGGAEVVSDGAGRRDGYPLQVPIELVTPNPFQPRQDFDEGAIEEMMRSIQTNGILQPLAVRPHGDGYQLIAGERRLRACMALGKTHVPIIIHDVPDDRMLELALVENLQRQDLNPIEKAEAFRSYLSTMKLTQQDAAVRLGVDRTSLTNSLRLLDLAPAVQQLVRQGALGMTHARTLAAISSHPAQLIVARRAIAEQLTVRMLERAVGALHRAEEFRSGHGEGAAKAVQRVSVQLSDRKSVV